LGRYAGSGEVANQPDWRWALRWALVILAVGCLPYLVAWLTTPTGYQFSGILVNPLDGNSYLAKMRQGWDGAWWFHLTYTPEPHDGALIFLFYLGLGHLARVTGLPLIAVYHAARILAGGALLAAVYAFICRLTGDGYERRLLFGLSSATAGLGWLGSMLGAFPIDLWVPEAFAFFSLLTNPHFPLAMALMLVSVTSVLWPARGVRCWLVPGMAGLVLALVAPFSLAAVYATVILCLTINAWFDRPGLTRTDAPDSSVRRGTGPATGQRHSLWTTIQEERLRRTTYAAVAAFIFSAPWVAYDYWVSTTNPAFAAWSAQNVTPTPSLVNLALGFGLIGLLAIPGVLVVVRQRDAGGLVLVAWSAATLVLICLPFALQRRLITGLGLPLAMLAGLGLTRFFIPRLPRQWARRLTTLTVGISLLGSLFLVFVLTAGALSQREESRPGMLYLSQDEAAGMQWLLDQASGEVVLAAPRTGMFLPGQAGVRVFYGHPFETIDAPNKEAQAMAFFRGQMSADEWHRLAARYNIRYVFFGPAERAIGANRLPEGLQPVFQQGAVTVYRVP
jgi:hypothetical protein